MGGKARVRACVYLATAYLNLYPCSDMEIWQKNTQSQECDCILLIRGATALLFC
jgi:hypothetical protein